MATNIRQARISKKVFKKMLSNEDFSYFVTSSLDKYILGIKDNTCFDYTIYKYPKSKLRKIEIWIVTEPYNGEDIIKVLFPNEKLEKI